MKTLHRSLFIAMIVSMVLVSACQPVPSPSPAATPCAGDACLPPTLIPTSRPVPTVNPTATPVVLLGDQRSKAKDQEITFWHSYSLNSSSLVNTLVDDFNRSNPDGIKVKVQAYYTDNQLNDALASVQDRKDLPDVVLGETALLSALDASGPSPDLTNFISDPLIGLSAEQQKSISTSNWASTTRQKKVVGIPAQKEAYFLLYNQTWAKELGFTGSSKTFTDFSDQTKAALDANILSNEKSKRGTGGWLINWQSSTALAWMGPDFVIPDDGKTFDQTILLNTFNELKKIQLSNNIWLGINPDPIPYFANRQAIFVSASSRELPEMRVHLNALKMADSWSIIPYPQLSTSASHFTRGTAYGLLSATVEKQIAGWLFIKWLMQPDNQAYIGAHEYTIPMDQMALDKIMDFTTETDILQPLIAISADSINYSSSPNWFVSESILADGFRQLFQPETTLDGIPGIIIEMDRTYSEFRK